MMLFLLPVEKQRAILLASCAVLQEVVVKGADRSKQEQQHSHRISTSTIRQGH